MIYEIVPARALHIKPMAAKLRQAHAIEMGQFGFDPRRALHDAVRQSHFARTALVDGQPEAMWGLMGTLLADGALVWFVMSDRAAAHPRLIVAEARNQLHEMGQHYSELATTILPGDTRSMAFATYLGFHDRHDGGFDQMTRKQRMAELLDNPRHHISLGDRHVIALGWHGHA